MTAASCKFASAVRIVALEYMAADGVWRLVLGTDINEEVCGILGVLSRSMLSSRETPILKPTSRTATVASKAINKDVKNGHVVAIGA